MSLGTEVGLGPGHIVLDWDAAPPREMFTAAYIHTFISVKGNGET